VLTGVKFNDVNGNGVQDNGELGIPNWEFFLDLDGDNAFDANERSTFTDANGVYTFSGLGKTTWFVREVQDAGWLQTTPNPSGVTVTGLAHSYHGGDFGNKQGSITGRVFIDVDNDGNLDVGELEPAKLSGYVYDDVNDNGQIDFGERAIPGAQIRLTGIDDLSNIINQIVNSDTQGYYEFNDMRPGTYTIDEQPPAGYTDGRDTLGSLGGSLNNDRFSDITLANGSTGINYNFGEHAATVLVRGMTATIGYWQNNNGQALIKSLNGGQNSTALGNWLATNFPNMYGASAGVNNLTNKTNAQVAAYYVTLFKQKGQKLDAQVLGLAFATYVTNGSLAGNNASTYGFIVNSTGTGAAVYNVGGLAVRPLTLPMTRR
jgi:hypothetical protein